MRPKNALKRLNTHHNLFYFFFSSYCCCNFQHVFVCFFLFSRCDWYLCSTCVLLALSSLCCSLSFCCASSICLCASFATHCVLIFELRCFYSLFYAHFRFLCLLFSLVSLLPFCFWGLSLLGLGLPQASEGFPDGTSALHQSRAAAAHRPCKSRQPIQTHTSSYAINSTK